MDLSKCMSSGNEGERFPVVHRHPPERLTNPVCGPLRIRFPVWTFGIDVDQTDFGSAKRFLQVIPILVTILIGQPLFLGAPVRVIRLPLVFSAGSETKCFETHGFHSNIPGQNDQIPP